MTTYFKYDFANVNSNHSLGIKAVSNGSACSSLVIEPSHVSRAMRLSDEDVLTSWEVIIQLQLVNL
jgi:cysteine desulfurase